MSSSIPAKLAAALVASQRAAKAVFLDSRNDFHRYKYASAESIIDEGRSALASAGLCLLTTLVAIVHRELPRMVVSKREGEAHRRDEVVVQVTYLLAHESGESLSWTREWPAVEELGRPLDKAVAAALTNGLGYAIRDLLLLPRDDDAASMDRRDDRPAEPSTTAHALAPAPAVRPSAEPEATAAPSSAAQDLDKAGKAYAWVLEEMAKGHLEGMLATIDKTPCSDETKRLLKLVLRGWEAESMDEFPAIAAELQRSGMSPAWVDEAKTQLKAPWRAAKERLAKRAA